MLAAEIQKGLAETTYTAPSVKDIELIKDVAAIVPYPESRVNELFILDWEKINPQRSAIIEKYIQRETVKTNQPIAIHRNLKGKRSQIRHEVTSQ